MPHFTGFRRGSKPLIHDTVVAVGTLWLIGSTSVACRTVQVGEPAPEPKPSENVPDDDIRPPDDRSPGQPNVETTDACSYAPAYPGAFVYSRDASGSGACATTTVSELLAAVHAQRLDLADIDTIYDPRGGISDGSYVYVFQKADGGFALAFKRGIGDCPSGCIENDYFYFETDGSCTPSAVGQVMQTEPEGCYTADSQPRWDLPRPFSAKQYCGADTSPQRLPRTATLTTCGGVSIACSAERESPTSPLTTLELAVTQDEADLSKATVSFSGTGTDLDGKVWPATVDYRSLHVQVTTDNLPALCPQSDALTFDYDFEGIFSSNLSYLQTRTPADCDGEMSAMCKGGIEAQLAVPR